MSAADTKAIGIAIAARAAADQVPSHISTEAKAELIDGINSMTTYGTGDFLAGFTAARDLAAVIVADFGTEAFEWLDYSGWLELMRSKAWKQKSRGAGTRDPFE